ncbi:MAG TPA: acyl-CoA-binding protein [Xanthomonadaceae bacterium]|nr:acyl-CoA-binding protein [Xanthomonadaceae bacterium]
MSDLEARFQQAAQDVQKLDDEPDNNVKLRLYALYKQATEGDIKGEKPGFFDFVGTAKYEAWEKVKGTDREEAMRQYVAQVERLTG